MNKSALRSFATNARRELLDKVKAKAMKIGITEEKIKKADVESSDAIFIDGRQLSSEEKSQRQNLINRIEQKGFNQVMEEVAYTWFNRFTALRFMEVNEYLPSNVRVLSSANPEDPIPDIIKEAMSLDFDIDKEWVYEKKVKNENDKLFQYLIIKQCNDLYDYLPFMFEKIDDYTEILFPEGLLAKDSFLRQMTNAESIPEEDWSNVEIIGWLYQYYIAEEKDRVFKAKKKYKSEEIPFATQLFTPDWIVRYMVQNSLGRYWVESHPEDSDLINNWEYYLEKNNEETNYYEEKIAPYINKELKVEDIKCFDPAMGSGHILIYLFDVLYEIYSRSGYLEREIPQLIIENNLFGLDIDDRAYQLASFSIVMKALEYNRRFLRTIKKNKLTLNVVSIQETDLLSDEDISYIVGENSGAKFNETKVFMEQFRNAKTIGSLIKINTFPQKLLEDRLKFIEDNPTKDLFMNESREKALRILPSLIKQAKIMGKRYDVLVTNPPYMGSGNMNTTLTNFLKKEYPDSKADLFACFMEINHFLKPEGFYASINQHSWMFLSSFEKVREKIIKNRSIENLLHLGTRAFEEIGGEVVQSTAFVLRNNYIPKLYGLFIRLVDEKTAKEKKKKLLQTVNGVDKTSCYYFDQASFNKIPESPIAYWVSDNLIQSYQNKLLKDIAFSDGQILTGNNSKFLRKIWEVDSSKISPKSDWVLHAKGGEYRRWYGNIDTVVSWSKESRDHYKRDKISRFPKENILFRKGITWTLVSSNPNFGVRFLDDDITFNKASATILFDDDNKIPYVLGFLNSNVAQSFLRVLNPTLNNNIKDVLNMPYIESDKYFDNVVEIVRENKKLSKKDWDNFETSWGFKKHPFLLHRKNNLENTFEHWKAISDENFYSLKTNEETLNRIFMKIYGLENELSSTVDEGTVSVTRANPLREIKSFISYVVGCIFGRYSPEKDGLAFAGGELNINMYGKYKVDKDNILPMLTGAYFEDDIVSLFIEFVKVTFGEETLGQNLDYIADTLGKKKNETAKETIRRYFLNDFFKDHLQTYKKRPIYWLFTSGKQKAFNCLIYMHRYDSTTLGRIRTDYLHELQTRMDAEKESLINVIEGESTAKEINQAKKELKTLDKKIEELKEYDEVLHHMADQQIEIDLDDGVEVNYAKFKDLLAKK